MSDISRSYDPHLGLMHSGSSDTEKLCGRIRELEEDVERLRARMEAARAILEKDDDRGESSLGWCIGLCLKAKLKAALFGDGQSPK